MEERGMSRKIALLSNVNMNALIRMLKKDAEVYEAEGYGNELGILMNPASSYHAFAPEVTFVVMDLMELLEHELDMESAKSRVENWFSAFESAMTDSCIYYISDAYLWGLETETACTFTDTAALERIWDEALRVLCERYANVRILPYRRMITMLGEENAFSPKMWYMGRILLSGEAQKRLAVLIAERIKVEYRTPKKVLVLDLDNTLWGGLAGEHDNTPIQLSEEHGGLAYKNLQRVILQMQKQGVILAIISKNNPEDAEEILKNHPHMVLRPEHFAAKYINWKPKNENLMNLAMELNLGLDSFVFWDDNPMERLLVQETLPGVTAPDFPEKAEDLAPAMTAIYHEYFEKAVLTAEDKVKTAQYADNAKRVALQKSAVSFEDYLKQLKIVVTRVNAAEHVARLEALLNKTNQFNLTTKRHTLSEVQEMIQNPNKRVFVYRVEDCFGDNGIVAAVIVDVTEIPIIDEFVMSCRVMGKNVEHGILSNVEKCLKDEGFEQVRGCYIPTAKNKPVEDLYEKRGYECLVETSERQEREKQAACRYYSYWLKTHNLCGFVGEIKEEV
ncbi:MAG: HAD-IIIC family phosphatase [Lachnospiraceae bacterium]|nr:HAD-IIIC family phosphatase [Lachnospiraceae bacterium]